MGTFEILTRCFTLPRGDKKLCLSRGDGQLRQSLSFDNQTIVKIRKSQLANSQIATTLQEESYKENGIFVFPVFPR